MTDLETFDPSKGLGELDRALVAAAANRKSAEEMSEMTNGAMTPAECMKRVLDILERRDWLSQAQMKLLLIDDILALKESLMTRAIEFGSLDHGKLLIATFAQLLKAFEGAQTDIAAQMQMIDDAHAQIMLEGISVALERSFLELEKRYPEIRKAELLDVFQMAMPDAVLEIESRRAKR